ncbi:15803_t:CDS:2, partial [Funneliformis geosporum]
LKLYEIIKAHIPKTHDAIIYGKKCGQSGRTIAKNVGCSKTAVYNTLKCFRQTGSSTPKKQTGRPPLLNIPSQQELKAFVQENVGLSARIPRHKPAMTEAHCQIRLEW